MRYREQQVIIHEVTELGNIDFSRNIIESTVLFYNLSSFSNDNTFKDFVDKISDFYPLQLAVSGNQSEEMFDWMLKVIAPKFEEHDPEELHIMTAILQGNTNEEIIDEFFTCLGPSTDRFDNWKYYQIYLYGESERTTSFKNKITDWLKEQEDFTVDENMF